MAGGELFPETVGSAGRLTDWTPDIGSVAPDWRPLLTEFFASDIGQRLGRFIMQRLAAGAVIYPPQPMRALALTALSDVKVVVLGQDPYHGPGQAEGLAFSVAPGMRVPPSLRNIFKELARDPGLAPWSPPDHGSLVSWARQGVLLLNTSLTVEEGEAASHAGQGWEVLTSSIVSAVAMRARSTVYMLWGAHAQRVAAAAGVIERGGAGLLLRANHPSPLSATRGPEPFLGCGHFSRANAFLQQQGLDRIRW